MRIVFYTDQIAEQEQGKALPREVECDRLVRAAAQPRPNRLQKVAAALHKVMTNPTRDLPGFRPVEWRAMS